MNYEEMYKFILFASLLIHILSLIEMRLDKIYIKQINELTSSILDHAQNVLDYHKQYGKCVGRKI